MSRVLACSLALIPCLLACDSSPPSRSDGASLPASIDASVRRTYPTHRIVYCETRPSAQGPEHHVTLDRTGYRVELVVDDTGNVIRERAELAETEVPLEILGTIRNEFPEAEIPMAIRWRDRDAIRYELRMRHPTGVTSTLQINPAGMIVEDIDGEGVPGE